MTAVTANPYVAYRDELLAAGLLLPTGVEGLYGRSATLEGVLEGVSRLATQAGADLGAEKVRFPPLISRTFIERSDYLTSFPNLLGVVHSFLGGDAEHAELLDDLHSGRDWTTKMAATDMVVCPAACYPLYPLNEASTLPEGGKVYDILGFVFRHEPSEDPARMQFFRQHEFVYLGSAEGALAFRDMWIDRAMEVLGSLGLSVEPVVANDPFFGRAGRMLAMNQRDEALKFEIVSPICSTERPTAIASCNYHQDHFGGPYHIDQRTGGPCHTACVGFGLERITLALFKTHGLDVAVWPRAVRDALLP
jgi:seryl-tRNA synthetase